ncbi:50S ribosomal protein L14e [Methanosphaera stadtmanae]|uniref:50S ribosomal protein L14e n=1 Tax=Methanosphaera stadtmanae TaxID=2317 RepID=A0A328Q600_9EURY|nr:50S ribosomal protein L14e [Methanosphaera stadtmanae]RAP03006.1 50S ribosomal protein L14e [Methanosphaera stadtmanae]
MPAIEKGRVCVKIAGRETGKKCVIVDVIDENFVEIVGNEVKNKRCNIKHLEPVDKTVGVSDDIEAVKEALANL